jgi:hypothetical protein
MRGGAAGAGPVEKLRDIWFAFTGIETLRHVTGLRLQAR